MQVIKLSVGEDVKLSPADFIGKLLEIHEESYCWGLGGFRSDKNRVLLLMAQNAKPI